jgi:hypothetical protein
MANLVKKSGTEAQIIKEAISDGQQAQERQS